MDIISSAITLVSPSALPLLLVILFYIKIKNDRKSTKESRDQDSQKIHDEMISLRFELSTLKGRSDLHDDLIRDINKQISIMNVNMAGISQKIDDIIYIMREVSK